MVKKQFSKKSSAFFIAALIMVVFTAFFAVSAYALTDTTRPTILSVSPANNEKDISRIEQVTVVFSEAMNPSTINANTVTVMQRSTPELGVYRATAIEGEVTYAGRTATFTSNALLSPNQQYGNVFTVTIDLEQRILQAIRFREIMCGALPQARTHFIQMPQPRS